MISVSTAARRAIPSATSTSTRRIRTSTMSNNCQLRYERYYAAKQHRRSHLSLMVAEYSGISKSSAARQCLVRPKNVASNNNRSLSSSAPPSSKPPTSAPSGSNSGSGKKQKTGTTELIPNVALGTVLFGFVGSVFFYSMNSVGRGDGNAAEGDDPLAQLKAEAHEARAERDRVEGGSGGRMTDDEILALESGLGAAAEVDGDRIITDVAVAAAAEIAAIEEEANLKIFGKQQNEQKPKKKPWWRFGF